MFFYVVELMDDWNVDVPSWNFESHRVPSAGFSNDSKMMLMFSLQSDSRRTLIFRALGTCYHQESTIERNRYVGAGWLVWGGIILGSRTDLHFQSLTMTGHIYQDVILEQHVRLFRGAMGSEFLFMDDNARPHRANIVDECLQSEDITNMYWSIFSPDLNPIVRVWDMLGRRIAARQPPPTCLPKLKRPFLDGWCNIPQDQIDNMILSMLRRCPKEELLGLSPLKGQTRGEDIVNAVIECMDKHHIPLDKVVSILTDGAKNNEDGQEEPDSLKANKVYAGVQLSNKLENHFLKIDINSERNLKFQKYIWSCISGYFDVNKQLADRQLSQRLIIYFIVP
ncbi:transposable element Tcb2 transposase [Trichonephila clavipes]|nr:transposable element Tcb2 transposase [Trichonephila clavipes]